MHLPKTVDGRMFVQFIALIIRSALREEMKVTKLTQHYSVNELLDEMQTLMRINFTQHGSKIITEITKKQRDILQKIDVQI